MKKLLLFIPLLISLNTYSYEPKIPEFEFKVPTFPFGRNEKLEKQFKTYTDRVMPIIRNHAQSNRHCLQFFKLLKANLRKNILMLDETILARCIKNFDIDELRPRNDERIMGPNGFDQTEEAINKLLQLQQLIKEYDGKLLSQLADKLDEL